MGNGFEMWRWLFNEFQGGSDAIKLGGARRLQEWSRCTKLDQLSAHLDDWVECLQAHCPDLLAAPGTLRTMVLGIIPNEFEDELLAKPYIQAWQEIVNWFKMKTVYRGQKQLAEQARKPGGRINSLIIEHEPDDDEQPAAKTSDLPNEPPQWFIDHIHKLGDKKDHRGGKGDKGDKGNKFRGKKPLRISFEGCWHCGQKGHSRSACTEFQKILAAANKGESDRKKWKLPQGYSGKYEEAKKRAKAAAAKKSKVNALSDDCTEDEWESSDDEDIIGPAAPGTRLCAITSKPRRQRPGLVDSSDDEEECMPPPVPDPTWTRPARKEVEDVVDDDQVYAAWVEAKEDLINHFGGWAHKTTIKVQDPARRNLKQVKVNSEIDLDKMLRMKCKISSIAAATSSKKNNPGTVLPDLPLDDDEVWALVDSGSTLNAAWIKKHFPQYASLIIASKQQMRGDVATTAGGHELKHKGRCKVNTVISGIDVPIAFSNMKVDVPILSVRRMVKLGNDVVFTESGGTITNRVTGQILKFVEADGTYWIKLKVGPPIDGDGVPNASVFTRPGA